MARKRERRMIDRQNRALGVIASAMHCRVYVCMLWNYCVVLCIYEHGHDNVVRRLCDNIDHGIVDEPVDTSHIHFNVRAQFYTRAQRDQRQREAAASSPWSSWS